MSESARGKSAARRASVDAARGLAVLLMLQQHLGIWLLDAHRYYGSMSRGYALLNALGGAAAPLFLFLVGVGTALAFAPSPARSWRRGGVIFSFGVSLNLLTPSWFSWGSFYVLHTIGVFLLLAPYLKTSRAALYLALGSLVTGLILQVALDTPLKLTQEAMGATPEPLDALRRAFVDGHFPLFPWLFLPSMGRFAGQALRDGDKRRLLHLGVGSAFSALGLRALVAFDPTLIRSQVWGHLFRFTFYPATTVFLLSLLAICSFLLLGCIALDERKLLHARSTLVTLGRSSLTLFVGHILLFREGLDRLGARNRLAPETALFFVVLALIGAALLSRLWQRIDYRYGLEWLERRWSEPATPPQPD